MDCSWITKQLPELLQGALEPHTEQMVLEHLAHCEQCRRELAFWAQLGMQMRAQAAPPLPKALGEAVADRLGLRQPPTVRGTLNAATGALRLTGSAVRLALTLATNNKL